MIGRFASNGRYLMSYDVLTSYDAGQANQGIPDEDVLTFATQQEQAVEYGKQSATTYHP